MVELLRLTRAGYKTNSSETENVAYNEPIIGCWALSARHGEQEKRGTEKLR